jgi:tetratricopeptide (TPR) repeat protein
LAAIAGAIALTVTVLSGIGCGGGPSQEERASDCALAGARFAASQGENREALRKADLVLTTDPDHGEARLLRARALIALWRGQEAIREAQEYLETHPDDWLGHLIMVTAAQGGGVSFEGDVDTHREAVERLAPETAEAYMLRSLAAGTPGEALILLGRALEIEPDHGDAIGHRAWRLMEMKDFRSALADAERLSSLRSGDCWGLRLKALSYQGLHQEERALEELDRAIEAEPDDGGSYLFRSILYSSHFGESGRALTDLDRAIQLDPDSAWFLLTRAWLHLRENRVDEALADARRAGEIDPASPWPTRIQAEAYLSRGQQQEIWAVFQEAEKTADAWPDPEARALVHQGRMAVLFQLGNYPGALSEAERIVQLLPEEWTSYTVRARLRFMGGDAEGGIADCSQAAAMELTDLAKLHARAQALHNICNRPMEALRDLERIVEQSPEWVDPYVTRALQYAYTGDFEKGLADLNRCVELAGQWPTCYRNRAIMNERLGRREEALADCDTWTGLAPEDAHPHSVKAGILASMNRIDEALAAADRAVELAPADPTVYSSRIFIRAVNTTECEQVTEDMRQAIQLDPTGQNRSLMGSMALVHVLGLYYNCPDLYDLEDAETLARMALEGNPNSEVAQMALGVALYRRGRHAEAVPYQERARATYDGLGGNLFFLAMEHWQLGQKDLARSYYDEGVAIMEERDPESPRLARFRKEAAELMGIEP